MTDLYHNRGACIVLQELTWVHAHTRSWSAHAHKRRLMNIHLDTGCGYTWWNYGQQLNGSSTVCWSTLLCKLPSFHF